MVDWRIIKIPKSKYGGTKEYRWNDMWVAKSEESTEGWYIKDELWGLQYNEGGYMFVDASQYLVNAKDITGFNREDGLKFRADVQRMLINVAKSNAKEWAKAKKPVLDWSRTKEVIPPDYRATDNVLFKEGMHDRGFKRAKDALKMAEMLARWRDNWIGFREISEQDWGIINHAFVFNPEPEPEPEKKLKVKNLGSLFG